MKKTYIDSCILIAAFRGEESLARKAMEVLDDEERYFISSIYVQLEVLPKAIHHKNTDEVAFYTAFFDDVHEWVISNQNLALLAMQEGELNGLSALDALHVAAASYAGADELVTAEKREKPLFRATCVRVVSIRD